MPENVQTLPAHPVLPLHAPQLSVPPQPSEMVPQFLPWAAQVVGAQHVLATQTCVPGHAPQLTLPPVHGFGMVPHLPEQLGAEQPQTFDVPPPPQLLGVEQLPQFNVPPQPSET